MDITIVQQFQKISNNFLDNFFSFVTKFGEVIPFIVIFLLLYWCVNNKTAMQFLCTYLIGVALNSIIKHIFKRPRPYIQSPDIINKYNSSGYSFPSGHSASATLAFGGAYSQLKNKANKGLKIFFAVVNITIIVLVMLSRIYLGQHFLSDVLCGFLFAVLWLIVAPKIYNWFKSDHKALLFICPVALIVALFSASPFIVSQQFSKIYLICGLLTGLFLGYFLDRQFVKSYHKKSIWFIVIKGVVCCILTLCTLTLCLVISKHLITFYISFMLLGLIITVGFSALFEYINNLMFKRKNKHENV